MVSAALVACVVAAGSTNLDVKIDSLADWTQRTTIVAEFERDEPGALLDVEGRTGRIEAVEVERAGTRRQLPITGKTIETGPILKGDRLSMRATKRLDDRIIDGHRHWSTRVSGPGAATVSWPRPLSCTAGFEGREVAAVVEGDRLVARVSLLPRGATLEVSCGLSWASIAAERPDLALPRELADLVTREGPLRATQPEKLAWVGALFVKLDLEPLSAPISRPLEDVLASERASEAERVRLFVALMRALGEKANVARVASPIAPMAVPTFVPGTAWIASVPDAATPWFEVGGVPVPLCGGLFLGQRALIYSSQTVAPVETDPGDPRRSTMSTEATITFVEGREHGRVALTHTQTGCALLTQSAEWLQAEAARALGAPAKLVSTQRTADRVVVQLEVDDAPAVALATWNALVPLARWGVPHVTRTVGDSRAVTPLEVTTRVRVMLPPGFAMPTLPSDGELPGLRWTRTMRREGDTLEVTQRHVFTRLEKRELPDFSAAFPRDLELKHALRTAIEQHDWREAVAVAGDDRVSQSELALGAGLRVEAERLAKLAVKESPGSFRAAAQWLALQRTPKEQASAARRALALKPSSSWAAQRLLVTLGDDAAAAREADALFAANVSVAGEYVTTLARQQRFDVLAGLRCGSVECADARTLGQVARGEAPRLATIDVLERLIEARAYETVDRLVADGASSPRALAVRTRRRHEAQPWDETSPREVALETLSHVLGARTRTRLDVTPHRVEFADWWVDEAAASPMSVEELPGNKVLVTFGKNTLRGALLERSGKRLRPLRDLEGPPLATRVLDAVERGDRPLLRALVLGARFARGERSSAFTPDDPNLPSWAAATLRGSVTKGDRARLARWGRVLAAAHDDDMLVELAEAQRQLDLADDAVATLRERPSTAASTAHEPHALMAGGHVEAARADVARRLEVAPDDERAQVALAYALAMLGKTDEALEFLGKVAPTTSSLNATAWLRARDGRADDVAVKAARAARARAPRTTWVLGTVALTEALAGNLADTIAALEAYWAIGPDVDQSTQEVDLAAGVVAEALGFRPEAERLYRQASRPRAGTPIDDVSALAKARLKALATRR